MKSGGNCQIGSHYNKHFQCAIQQQFLCACGLAKFVNQKEQLCTKFNFYGINLRIYNYIPL